MERVFTNVPLRDFLLLGSMLDTDMAFEVMESFVSKNYASAYVDVPFEQGTIFRLGHLSAHYPHPTPNEDNTMSGWVIKGVGRDGWKQSSRQILEYLLSGKIRRIMDEGLPAALVARACSLISPDRVVELAREQAARQVMEG
jgi:hypothetical protein